MTHFKLKAVGTAVALALCSQANAFVDPSLAQVRLYVSGATAPTHMIREHVVQNLCSAASPIDVFVDTANVSPTNNPANNGRPILAHANQWVVQCVGETGTPAAGQNLLVAKSDPGGSAQGVNPVAQGIARPFLNTAACQIPANITGAYAGDGTTQYDLRVCGNSTTLTQVPDMGVSDIEPERFVGPLSDPATGDFAGAPANWQVEVGPGLVFGVVVTTPFRNELQRDQFGGPGNACVGVETPACQPSLPSWFVRSVFSGKLGSWATQPIYGQTINVDAGMDARVHICRRTQGSGTHAQFLVHYARTGCNRAATLPMPAGSLGPIPGTPVVFENGSSGNVDNCMNALTSGAGFASTPAVPAGRTAFGIGYQSLEKNGNLSLNYRFVKIDGVAPTLRNTFNGDYDDVYFLSYNHRENDFRAGNLRGVPGATEAAILESMIDSSFDLSSAIAAQINVDFPHSFAAPGEGGAFVVPVLPASAPATFTPSNPVVPWARRNSSNSGPDSCAPIYRR